MLRSLSFRTKLILTKFWHDERGEGMIGWIAGALLTVTIVVALHGLITGWLPTFWSNVQARIESIV